MNNEEGYSVWFYVALLIGTIGLVGFVIVALGAGS